MGCICRLGVGCWEEKKIGFFGGSKNTQTVGSQPSKTCAMWRVTLTWKELGGESIVT